MLGLTDLALSCQRLADAPAEARDVVDALARELALARARLREAVREGV
jgi:hypothetical protein